MKPEEIKPGMKVKVVKLPEGGYRPIKTVGKSGSFKDAIYVAVGDILTVAKHNNGVLYRTVYIGERKYVVLYDAIGVNNWRVPNTGGIYLSCVELAEEPETIKPCTCTKSQIWAKGCTCGHWSQTKSQKKAFS